jgi:sialate O-acetylesterase
MRLGRAWMLIAAVFTGNVLFAQVRLPRLVRDSMVMQRDTPLKLWGWASKNERVTVSIQGKKYKTAADNAGRWAVTINPIKAGGPHTIDIVATNTITLKNVLIGDVWLCAGQSNMVHYLDLHKERYADDIAKANYPEIRNFTLPTATNLQKPEEDLPRGNWKSANPNDVKRFGVVAYFFARDLYERYHIPIGIINASVGGTPIEAWTSEAGLKEFPDIMTTLQQNKDTAYVNPINRAAQKANVAWSKRKVEDKGLTESVRWYDTTYVPKGWHTINVPGYWEDQGVRDLDGVVWYRTEINLPAQCKGMPAKISLGRIVDADFLYVNGVLVGNTGYQYPQRRYEVPTNILKAGKNILVVRVLNNNGKGGFVPDKPYALFVNNQSFDLKGYWQYKAGEVYDKREPVRSISAQNQPAALFNGMVAPLINYAIKGILWYQGETNTGQPEIYQKLLPALIQDWRKQWQQPTVPFLFVQLPNFMEVNYSPSESSWARLRESQLKALSEPNTAMAVAIELGEWNDIHPGNKKPIGDRLALAARNLTYGEKDLVYSGPLFESAQIDGQKIVLRFTHVGSGLITYDGEPLQQFAIAGEDKKFVWAKAVIENNTVVVWHDAIAFPKFVRYAWADNPQGANLYNKEGLPASPFRTDK